jgi:hypothetical protein
MTNPPKLSAVPVHPHWDESVAGLLESTKTHVVEYDVNHTDDGKVVLRKTIWLHRTRTERHLVWVGDVMILSKGDAVDITTEFVQALADL